MKKPTATIIGKLQAGGRAELFPGVKLKPKNEEAPAPAPPKREGDRG